MNKLNQKTKNDLIATTFLQQDVNKENHQKLNITEKWQNQKEL